MKKIAIIMSLFLTPFAGFAAEVKPVIASPVANQTAKFLPDWEVDSHHATLARVQDYLSSLTTLTSEFTQVAPDGSVASGKFYLQRPEKMRWQYNPPTPILMVANGSELIYYDSELEQISHIPLGSTLIGFLAQEKIRFDNAGSASGVGIISFTENAGIIRIGLAQRGKLSEGQLVLEFSDNPLVLRSMVVTDASGQVTNVSLNNAQFGGKLDQKLFDFRDPRKKRGG